MQRDPASNARVDALRRAFGRPAGETSAADVDAARQRLDALRSLAKRLTGATAQSGTSRREPRWPK